MEHNKFDPLADFNAHFSPGSAEHYIAEISRLINDINPENRIRTANLLQKIIGETQSTAILKLICSKKNIDFHKFISECEFSSQIILHFLCLHACYNSISAVAYKLQIDDDLANLLVKYLQEHLRLDDILHWLEIFKESALSPSQRLEVEKLKQFHGREIVNQALDTAEERKINKRRMFHRHIRPGIRR